ncbi:Cyclochlorotine biosynthesis O [Hyphodiscus hymeniophilus]|uniref:Cyclochlorotine biosynthesis O n=1 Tax=Hyphodiscus hymeniophilus TaxID=353542 RepID=A0A9P7AVM0_9HELO|nr:Cyclochlorotine biosynthesis O [Hyphodiscus hymeniophilus]
MAPLNPVYKPIGSSAVPLEDDSQYPPQPPSNPRISTVILSFTTLISALLALYFSQLPKDLRTASEAHSGQAVFNLRTGYDTEWEPAKASIDIQKVTYTSALRYNATSDTYYRDFDPSTPQYVGKPNADIDQAWSDLLKGQYLVLSEEEAMQLDDPVAVMGYYLGEVEVMHSLHCLNAIRKEIHREYYKDHDMHPLPDNLRSVHVDHCLEQLRQNIQCAGDLTPVLLRPYGIAPNINLVGTPQIHTCRNWEALRQWWTERTNTTGGLDSGGLKV